jgi:hypothetical protein
MEKIFAISCGIVIYGICINMYKDTYRFPIRTINYDFKKNRETCHIKGENISLKKALKLKDKYEKELEEFEKYEPISVISKKIRSIIEDKKQEMEKITKRFPKE